MDDLKNRVNSIVADFISGSVMTDDQIDLLYNNIDIINKVGDINDCNTYGFVDRLERINDIRKGNSNNYLRTYVAMEFVDSYRNAEHYVQQEVSFDSFLNDCGYPNSYLLAIDAKYMLNISDYIDIYKKGYEMCRTGANVEDIAQIF